ncbi:MAG: UDP-N-acetylmuramate:L-alanyl-gamma-D-glutamyl-meso-diaminopimelate ligase [Thermodesulfobacteriota bacterium]
MDNKTRPLPKPSHIHLMGICGVAMSSLAGMLTERGYTVTGSDQNTYPPISTFLESLSISVDQGYSPSHLHPRPDLVVVGNVITRDNPEAEELVKLGIPYLSMPQALRRFVMKGKKSIVIAGTHGKTTVSALTAWILEAAGMDPSFMIGGIAKNFYRNFKLGQGRHFVIEGDEYDTAFFDKSPKFLHYAPYLAAITNIEFDHADIYAAIEEIEDSFGQLIGIVQEGGALCANVDDSRIAKLIQKSGRPCVTFAIEGHADFTLGDTSSQDEKAELTVNRQGKEYLKTASDLLGNHNIYNILAAIALASSAGIPRETIAGAINTFQGVKRRLETLGTYHGITVVDDFAHHPTAVRETIQAVRARYKDKRLIAVFEPRSNSSRRNIFQDAYAASFEGADVVILPEPPMMEKIPPQERFSSAKLARDLNGQGTEAHYFLNTKDLLDGILTLAREGDVILIMSNGAFDNIQQRLIEDLKAGSV